MSRVYVIEQFALFAAFALAFVTSPPGQTPLLRVLGLALVVVGIVLLALAIREYRARNATLPNITPTPDSHADLVESGIYALVRHPIYSAVLFGAVGLALIHGNFSVMLVALVMIMFFTLKSKYEENLLRVVYPQYSAYIARTRRFLPLP